MNTEDKIIAKLTDIDENVKDIKAELATTKIEVSSLKSHVEGFVKLHETLDCEVAALRHKVDWVQERVLKLETTS